MKFLGLLAITIAASVLVSGCVSSASGLASLSNTECGGKCDGSCTDCDGSCRDCGNKTACGDCKKSGNCTGSHDSNCGDAGSASKVSTTSVFSTCAEFANGSTNGGLKNFDVSIPTAERIVMDLTLTSHAVGCSSVGIGEIVVALVDESNNVVFRNVYTDDGTDSVELSNGGGKYTLLIEGLGSGNAIKVICDVNIWATNPSSDGCAGCGGCPP
ncbi:MAG: hypothetical protein PHH26_06745, partial [Candidatus Thermoplasmatota archaeon]|nr:hypothetical protein [Candidatus Thermoplasmatota archaeon]